MCTQWVFNECSSAKESAVWSTSQGVVGYDRLCNGLLCCGFNWEQDVPVSQRFALLRLPLRAWRAFLTTLCLHCILLFVSTYSCRCPEDNAACSCAFTILRRTPHTVITKFTVRTQVSKCHLTPSTIEERNATMLCWLFSIRKMSGVNHSRHSPLNIARTLCQPHSLVSS